MRSLSIREIPYRSAISGEWENMVDYYEKFPGELLRPVTLSLDTGFHLAVHSNKGKPLEDLKSWRKKKAQRKNKFGNTALHEATINGNYEAVRLLVERCADLLSIRNEDGETPLFTAAGFGQAGIVKFLILSQQEQCVNDQWRLLPIHRKRSKDKQPILGAAIVGQHFETALLLLEVDASLHSMEDNKKRTALQLLAEIPSAFESGFPMGIFQRLFYCALRHHEVKLEEKTREQASQGTVGDPERGQWSCSEWNSEGGYWPATLAGFWNKKTKHVFALRLAKILIERDESWDIVSGTEEGQDEKQTCPPSSQVKQGDQRKNEEDSCRKNNDQKGENELSTTGQNSEISSKRKDTEEVQNPTPQTSAINTKEKNMRKGRIALFIAARNGIIEIVSEIIEIHPHATEQLNARGQSILDVAVMHRQEKIFRLVKQQKIPLARLHRVIDNKGNTLLHHVADMEYYRKAYKAAMSGDWKNITHHYQDRPMDLSFPVTLSADTALHIAVYSKQAEPLQSLLEVVNDMENFILYMEAPPENDQSRSTEQMKFLMRKNKFGNTALHEATICGNYEAVTLLVARCPALLKEKNKYGETPLFTAAGFGEAEIVAFLFSSEPEQRVNDKRRLFEIHRQREDGLSILSAAIIGQHFVGFGQQARKILEPENKTCICFETRQNPNTERRVMEEHQQNRGKTRRKRKRRRAGNGRGGNKKGENEFSYSGQPSEILSKSKELEEVQHQTAQPSEILSKSKEVVQHPTAQPSVMNSSLTSNEQISLFLATGNGIEEIVRGIIKQYPHAIKKLE
uniref:PGG domain-containing protein n=1 Tax=Salix viminalis TaxID=40686 RepID=A0A6N2M0D4_SALVM